MELNRWYTLTDKAAFCGTASTINSAIAKYIGDKPFMVTEYKNNGIEISAISFDGKKNLYREEEILGYPSFDYGHSWIYANEFDHFTEIKDYDTEDEKEDTYHTEELDHIVVVNESSESSYGNYRRRVIGFPTMYTKKMAEKFAKEFLEKTDDPDASVEIFRLESTAKVVKEVKFS